MYTCQNEGECARRMNTTVNAYFWFDFLLTVTCTSEDITVDTFQHVKIVSFAVKFRANGTLFWGVQLRARFTNNARVKLN